MFLIALNIALGIVVMAWLHSPPFGNQRPDMTWWDKLWNDPNATFAMFVAGFTAGLVILGYKQFRDSRLLQRAYLSVEPLGVRQGSTAFFADIGIRNAGRLPARNVAWLVRVERFSTDNQWNGFLYEQQKSGGTHVIPAGGLMRRTEPTSIDGRFILKALDGGGEYFLYVWGEVTYTDGFGQRRFVRFCHRYNYATFKARPKGYDAAGDDGRYHESGNDAD